jgi:hypothetical protein
MSNQYSASYVRRLLFVAVAGVGVMAFAPGARAGDPAASETNPPAQPQAAAVHSTQPPVLPAGFVVKDENAADGVKSTMVQLTQRAVTKDSYDSFFSGFLSDLAKRDKDRAREFTGVNQAQLNDTIGQIQTGWQSKYSQDFQVTDKNLVFDERFVIVQGEVSDPSLASEGWPVSATAVQAANVSPSTDQQQNNLKELTAGREVAVIYFPAGEGIPAMQVSMIHQEMTGWHLDIPVDRTGEQIYTALSAQLKYLASHQELWPADVTDGYRMVARHVAAALYGTISPVGTANAQ